MNTKRISVLGCGWLGMHLALSLQEKGFSVKGSKTSTEGVETLQQKGIKAFKLVLDPPTTISIPTEFLESDTLIINIPPRRREDIVSYHLQQINELILAIEKSSIKQVIFVSSTSVYPNTNSEVTEEVKEVPSKSSGKALLLVEELLQQQTFKATIVRFAGLIGDDRLPGRFLAGKKNLKNGNAPVNLIHRDDCISILTQIIEQDIWGEVFNACSDKHPLRKDFYELAAKNIGLEIPVFDVGENNSFKIISSEKLKSRLNYTFIHPDPMTLI